MTVGYTDTGFVEVPGARLAYDAVGQGSGLVLVHAGICDRRMWDPVVPRLSSTHRLVCYDCRGFGETQVTGDVPFSNRADLIAMLDHHGMNRAAVVEVSRGGQIVIDAAVECPDRFSLRLLQGVAHLPPMERPDEFGAVVETFLEEVPA